MPDMPEYIHVSDGQDRVLLEKMQEAKRETKAL
jgi:hypothetical protein